MAALSSILEMSAPVMMLRASTSSKPRSSCHIYHSASRVVRFDTLPLFFRLNARYKQCTDVIQLRESPSADKDSLLGARCFTRIQYCRTKFHGAPSGKVFFMIGHYQPMSGNLLKYRSA